MRAEQAASYMSISKAMFLRLVDEGMMPPPVPVPGHAIVTWDRLDLDDAYQAIKDRVAPTENTFDKAMRGYRDGPTNRKKIPVPEG